MFIEMSLTDRPTFFDLYFASCCFCCQSYLNSAPAPINIRCVKLFKLNKTHVFFLNPYVVSVEFQYSTYSLGMERWVNFYRISHNGLMHNFFLFSLKFNDHLTLVFSFKKIQKGLWNIFKSFSDCFSIF